MKNNFIKFFTLIIAIIISISCGNEITPPENDNDNEIGKVIVVDADKTYTVRIGSIITNIKPSDMTNAWKDYIGGKKVLRPYDKKDVGWYFEKGTANYHEPKTFHATNPRADFIDAVIMSNHGEAYLMGMYYNNKILGEGFSQYMLIYIQADGQERGYYGGGSDKNKKPDYSTVWTHYQASLGVDPLGILADNDISKDPDPNPEPTPDPEPTKKGDLSLILGKFQNQSYKGEWIETGEDYDLNVFYSYSMKVLETNWISETECYLYGQYTATAYKPYYDMGFEDEDIESMGITINTGKYYAIHIKNLTSNSYEYSGALKDGIYAASTLEEVKTWTVESGWFDIHSKLDKVLTKSSFRALNINVIDIKEISKTYKDRFLYRK